MCCRVILWKQRAADEVGCRLFVADEDAAPHCQAGSSRRVGENIKGEFLLHRLCSGDEVMAAIFVAKSR